MTACNQVRSKLSAPNFAEISGLGLLSVWAMLIVLCAATSAQQPPPVQFQFSSFNVPGSLETIINGMDNSGNMVGMYTDQLGLPHGFEYTATNQLITIDHPNFMQTVCYGAQGGSVVGAYLTPVGYWQAFYYSQGVFIDIPMKAGVKGSIAYGMNAKGLIVGWYLDANNVDHGFEWNSLKLKTIDVPGMLGTSALAINRSGQITFNAYDSNFVGHGWLKKGKNFTRIDASPYGTSPRGISDTGEIVVSWQDAVGASHGGLLLKNGWYLFDQPQSYGTWLRGINRTRQIVGYFQTDPVQQNSLIGLQGSYQP